MNRLMTVGILSLVSSLACASPTRAEEIAETWVQQLRNEDFTKRMEAEKNILAAGAAAAAALEHAAKSQDAEMRLRANLMLAALKTEPILVKMQETVTKTEFLEADLEMKMNMMGMQTGGKGHFKGKGNSEQFVMDQAISMNGQEFKMHLVCDGTTLWIESTIPGGAGKRVQKMSLEFMNKMGGQQTGTSNPMYQVKQMRENFDFTKMKEETLDGAIIYVIEGKLKPDALELAAKNAEAVGGAMAAQAARAQMQKLDTARIFIAKDDFVLRQYQMLDAQGSTVLDMKLSNFKTNVPLTADLFKYNPPEGARVIDIEQMVKGIPQGGGGEKAPPAEGPTQGGF
ncbi:MAG: hypothetical protein HS116_16945 [Planctomycetes bacterium]|nr:hypothetical protein [Planctomycetota bacterium]